MKRFYKEATVRAVSGGWQVFLDDRGIKTQGGRPQVTPTEALAAALSTEWAAQGEEIDPARFAMRDMADFAIDVVAPDRGKAIDGLLRYAETDTLCYRAEAGEPLAGRQTELWEPLLKAAEARWDVHFERIDGIIHRPQPVATLARLRAVLEPRDDFVLSALTTLASLAASLTVALAATGPDADAEKLWAAANLEEDWQAELWGQDDEAVALRNRRFTTFATAMNFARLSEAS
ncbi:MAG: molecular chaperone [Sphingomonadales bacterium]|nr:molecular chaperone [Sphingomonadales bacterium]